MHTLNKCAHHMVFTVWYIILYHQTIKQRKKHRISSIPIFLPKPLSEQVIMYYTTGLNNKEKTQNFQYMYFGSFFTEALLEHQYNNVIIYSKQARLYVRRAGGPEGVILYLKYLLRHNYQIQSSHFNPKPADQTTQLAMADSGITASIPSYNKMKTYC